MNRYWQQLVLGTVVGLIALLIISVVCLLIWRIALRKGVDRRRLRRLHGWLIACVPLALIVINIGIRWEGDSHTTALWAYAILPALIASPFIASLVGLMAAEQRHASP
jgi:hypothetical protein